MARRTTRGKGPSSRARGRNDGNRGSSIDPEDKTKADQPGPSDNTAPEIPDEPSPSEPAPDAAPRKKQDAEPDAQGTSAEDEPSAASAPEKTDTVSQDTSEADATQKMEPEPAPSAEERATQNHDATPDAAEPEMREPAEPEKNTTAAAAAPPPAKRQVGFFPLLLGGLVAGGIGYGAHYLTGQSMPATEDEIAQLRTDLSALQAAIDDQPAAEEVVDLGPLEAELADLRDRIDALPAAGTVLADADLEAAVDQLRSELAQAEDADIASVQEQVRALQESLDDQQSTTSDAEERAETAERRLTEAEDQIAALIDQLAELRDLAERRVVDAEAAIDEVRAQAGLDTLRAAMETGAPYESVIAALRDAGVTVPDALEGPAASGVATIDDLQENFPQARGDALRVALQDAPADNTLDRLGNFFRAQVGARSTVPREGDDPDAILSRATAAVEQGDIAAAVAEIDALSEDAQIAKGSWLDQARARVAAQAALAELANTITTE